MIKNNGQAIHYDALKAASDLLQLTTGRGYEEISEDIHKVSRRLQTETCKLVNKQIYYST